jgi:hypothetical protein
MLKFPIRNDRRVLPARSLTRQLVATLLIIGVTLPGCSPSLGVRPPRPDAKYAVKSDDPCARLNEYLDYSRDLEEAYHSRATQNRWWIYVAGTLGLATIAASGGMAAAAVSTTTIAVVSIAGGFTSGFFAFVGNDRLAEVYTEAANSVDVAIADASGIVKLAESGHCADAYVVLVKKVSAAATQLEEDRTTTAQAALLRAKTENKKLKEETDKAVEDLKAAQTRSSVFVPLTPLITDVDPPLVDPASLKPITLTVSNVDFKPVAQVDLKVRLVTAGPTIPVDAPPCCRTPNSPMSTRCNSCRRRIRQPLDRLMDTRPSSWSRTRCPSRAT